MEFKHAISILFSNIGYTLKILVWILISLLLTVGVGCAIIIPIARVIGSTTEASYWFSELLAKLNGFLDGSLSVRGLLQEGSDCLENVFVSIATNKGATVGLVFGGVFVYAFYCFVFGLGYYPVAHAINNIMASNLRYSFANSLVMNLKNAARYSAARLSISLPIDLIFVTIMGLIIFGLFPLIYVFVLPIAIVVAMLFTTMRAMLFAGWLPRMIYHPEERVYVNFLRSLIYVKSNFGGFFKSYIITFFCAYLIGVTCTLPTGGIMLVLLPSIYFFLLRTVELVGYFKVKGYNFYVDANNVVNTVEYGYRADTQTEFEDSDK